MFVETWSVTSHVIKLCNFWSISTKLKIKFSFNLAALELIEESCWGIDSVRF